MKWFILALAVLFVGAFEVEAQDFEQIQTFDRIAYQPVVYQERWAKSETVTYTTRCVPTGLFGWGCPQPMTFRQSQVTWRRVYGPPTQ